MGAARGAAARLAPQLWRCFLGSRCASPARGLSTSAAEPWPVVIAGGGPTGLAAAMLLAKYGVRSLVLERSPQLTDHPQAHFINMRAMEVFRTLDGLSTAVTDLVPPLHQWRRFVYCESMTGDLMGSVDHFQGQETPAMPFIGPEPVAHLAQHRLLPLMAERVAARHPTITLRMGHSVARVEQDGDAVRAEVEGPQGERYNVSGSYLIAADGARSAIRSQLGIGMEGPGGIQHLINVHFVSPELGRLLAGREGMLYFVFGSRAIAVVVAHNIDAGEFVAQVPYFPPLQHPEDFTPAACTELMRRVAGRPGLALEMRTVRPWTMSGRVAASYQRGRVFLVGDAAHQFPPSGAFGMNTGVCDAHNLAWKLAATLHGWAGPALLDSYTPERKPVGLANMRLSADNFYEELRVPATIGLDYHAANMLSDALAAPALSFIPEGLRTAALNGAFSAGMAGSAVLRRLRKRGLSAVFAGGETLRLQFPKEDLGYLYHAPGAAVCRSREDDAAVRSYLAPKPREAPYQPCTLPGARLPHCPITLLQPGCLDVATSGGGGAATSTLDLAAACGAGLALVLSDSPAVPAWLAAAARCEAETGVPLRPVVVAAGSGCQARGAHIASEASDSVAVALNEDGTWEGLRGVGAEGALLVRPDGHVGWRCKEAAAAGPGGEAGAAAQLQQRLCQAVGEIMGLARPTV